MSWRSLCAPGLALSDSPTESRRFGLSVGRVHVGPDVQIDASSELRDLLRAAPQDVLVVRYPADRLAFAPAVAGVGRAVLPAGSLTYWGGPSDQVRRAAADQPGLSVTSARAHAEDGTLGAVLDVVDEVVAASFAGYGNHYVANPLLDDAGALAGYQEWARGRVTSAPDEVLLLQSNGSTVGVATCEADTGGGDLEVLLAGLVPAAQGQGWYGPLLAACARVADERNLQRTIISTQVHNTRVQRAWARLGLLPFGAVETVHCVRSGLLPA